jgi:hypothetical protein
MSRQAADGTLECIIDLLHPISLTGVAAALAALAALAAIALSVLLSSILLTLLSSAIFFATALGPAFTIFASSTSAASLAASTFSDPGSYN